MESPLRIISLQAENVKRLKAVRIVPGTDDVVVLEGENGEGKSSVLDAIAYTLGGADLCPPNVIRTGEKAASVTVDLGEFLVTRKWTASGTKLEVKARDGAKYPSPQAILDKLVGRLSFDPLEFTRQKPTEQIDTLRRIVGLDFTAHDAARKALFDDRTVTNRQLVRETAVAAAVVEFPDAPAKEVVVADLLAEQQRLLAEERVRAQAVQTTQEKERAAAAAAKAATSSVEAMRADVEKVETARAVRAAAAGDLLSAKKVLDSTQAPDFSAVRARLAAIEEERVQLQRQEDALREMEKERADLARTVDAHASREREAAAAAEAAAERVKKAEEAVKAAERARVEAEAAHAKWVAELAAMPTVDLEGIRARLAGAEETNRKVRANAERKAAEQKRDATKAESERQTKALEAMDAAKVEALERAPFPVPGLSLGETGVTLKGLPLEQASSADRIRVSLAIGLALNPRLRVMFIRDGSLLDRKSMALIAEEAAKHNAQCWIERVGTGSAGSIIIEDGEVKS